MIPYWQSVDDDLTIYRGDNALVMPQLAPGSVDLVLTSPPYNLGNTTGGGVKGLGHYRKTDGMGRRGGSPGKRRWERPALAKGYDAHDDNLPHAAYVRQQKDFLLRCWRLLSADGAIYYNHKPRILGGRLISPFEYIPRRLHPQIRQVIIWDRAGGINATGAFYTPFHEWIVVVARDAFRLRDKAASGAGDVWRIPPERGNDHPAPFPLAVPLRAIETTRARTILDPYMGSGTTLLAAKVLGRSAIGIELSAAYCDQAVDRLTHTARKGTERYRQEVLVG